MEVLLCIVFGVFILLSFSLGYRYGKLSESKEEPVIIKEKPKKKKNIEPIEEDENFYKAINNMENYNGSSIGQEVIK